MSRRPWPLAVLCLGLLAVAAAPLEAREAAPESLRPWIVKRLGRQAYGVYADTRKSGWVKVGWFIEETRLGKYQGREVAVQGTEGYFVTVADGEKSTRHEKTDLYFSLQGDGGLVHAEERISEDKVETVRTAVRKNNRLVITTTTPKRTLERRVPLPRETLAEMRKLERWLEGNPARGATFESYSTALDQERIDIKEHYTYRGKKSILWGGVPTTVYLVRVRAQGANFNVEMKADGKVIKGRIGEFLETRAEKETVAKKLDGLNVDLLAASSVPVDRALGKASRVEALTLEATGLGDFALPASHRQRVRAGKNGTAILDLRRDHRTDRAAPLADAERTRYLRATPSIQSDSEIIRRQAKRIVGREQDPIKAATLLAKWVHKNLKQTMAANASTALDVLDNKAGDCTEHALLFVTLARAAGLPAREVGGVAYVNRPPLFGWHAWAEVHDGRQWVTVDPTWDQVYVDATHVKFSEGSEDMAWANVVGKLKFKVVRVERTKP